MIFVNDKTAITEQLKSINSLPLRIGQSLTMTPQLQQAIKLLQLSTLELQTEIQEALESNPMLEVEENTSEDASTQANSQSPEKTSSETKETTAETTDTNTELNTQTDNLPDDLPVDTAWEDIYDIPPSPNTTSSASTDQRDFFENQSIEDDGLISHLLWQLQCTPMSETDNAIGLMIIDAINEDGYLTESNDELLAGLRQEAEQYDDIDSDAIEIDEIEAVLNLIQHFDPPGVAAHNLQECLSLQLDIIDDGSSLIKSTRTLN